MIVRDSIQFLFPFSVIIVCWLALTLTGLPLTLALLSRERRWLAISLSPIVAMALISSAYQYWFFLLLQPYRPLAVYGAITILSLAILITSLWLRGEPFASLRSDLIWGLRRIWPHLLVPLFALAIFSSFFVVNGLELLSAGGDDFFYIQTARHIIEHLFTRDAVDFPWAGAEHYLGDFPGHTFGYLPTMRLGAFFLLADISYIFGVVPEKAFPLLMGVGIVVGTASLALLQLLIRRSLIAILAAQLALATSGLLVVLHFQGSLSSVVTLGLRLGGLSYILWAIAFSRKVGPLILAGVLGASWLLLYHESIGVNLVLPLAVGFTIACFRAIRGRPAWALRFAARCIGLIVLIYALQPSVLADVIANHWSYIGKNSAHVPFEGVVATYSRASAFASNRLPAFLGYHSLYDDSAANYYITSALLPYSLAIFLGLAILAALGFWLRLPAVARHGWAAVPLAIASIAFTAAFHEDAYFMIRSAQMAMPHIFVGLSLLAFVRNGDIVTRSRGLNLVIAPRSVPTWTTGSGRIFVFKRNVQRWLTAWSAIRIGMYIRIGFITLWICVVALNAYTVVRTLSYTNRHSQATDPLVRHFNPDSPLWQQLRELLIRSDNAPVLLSGFRDIRPYMIAVGLRSIPHLVGDTIVKVWPDLDPGTYLRESVIGYANYRHWLTAQKLTDRAKTDPVWNWPTTYKSILARSRSAIIPLSGAYPPEWSEWPSLFAPRGWRFINLCDVLDRNAPAFRLESELLPSGRDEIGPFWVVNGVVSARPELRDKTSVLLEVRYDGTAPSLMIDGVEIKAIPRKVPQGSEMVLTTQAVLSRDSVIGVRSTPDARLRSIGLYSLPIVDRPLLR